MYLIHSLEFIESKYHSNKLVDNVCAFADPFHDFVVGLIVPNKAVIRELSDLPFEEAIENEEVLKKVKAMLKEKYVRLMRYLILMKG